MPKSLFSKSRAPAYKISTVSPGFLKIERRSHRIPDIVLNRVLDLAKNVPISCATDFLADQIEDAFVRFTHRNPVIRSVVIESAKQRDYKTLSKFFLPVIQQVTKNFPHTFQ